MKKNLLITTLLLVLTMTLLPIKSYASDEDQSSGFISKIPYIYQLNSSDTSFTWKLPAGEFKTKSIYCKKNTTIYVAAVIASSSSKARLGIIEPDGTYHTTSITGSGTFSYIIPSSGIYEIYCKNTSSRSYSVGINYTFD